ncbi:Trimeric GatFAB AmidoTransferase(AdT) complex subunit [Myotisia sp. PD_48]|nr:Trimeric GatFAB AmidoTransferase(AdT) complex subunit [Myotisia sp. PD_48]
MSLLRQAEKCLLNQQSFAHLNAFITPLESSVSWREQVREADSRQQQHGLLSPLDGKLIAIKDNICTRDLPTTCGSAILEKFKSPFDAAVVSKLRESGAVIAGKTNLDEFGMGSHSIHSHFGPVKNQNTAGLEPLSAGGSSGGSAVAVATGQCHAALGTDTGGSVRLPAAYTGIFGFKPSYGYISRWGVVAYANSLDTVGILAPNTAVIRDVFDCISGFDPRDPTSLRPETRNRVRRAAQQGSETRGSKLRIGLPVEYNIHELSPIVRSTWTQVLQYLQSLGHSIHPVSLPTTKTALSAYYVLAPAEASSNLAKYDGVRYGTRNTESPDNAGGYLYGNTRGTGFGPEVKRRILLGALSLSAEKMDNYFIQAQRIRRLVQSDFNSAFRLPNALLRGSSTSGSYDLSAEGVDVLVCPTAPTTPPSIKSLEAAPAIEAYTNDVFTLPSSMAGLPALSVPVRVACDKGNSDLISSVHPCASAAAGIQIVGQFGDDQTVLAIGALLEEMPPIP